MFFSVIIIFFYGNNFYVPPVKFLLKTKFWQAQNYSAETKPWRERNQFDYFKRQNYLKIL